MKFFLKKTSGLEISKDFVVIAEALASYSLWVTKDQKVVKLNLSANGYF